MERLHAGGACARDIAHTVVNEHRPFGLNAIAREEKLEDLRIGLQRSSPDTTIPSKLSRKSKRWRASRNLSWFQLVIA
jgi:hypothetical protein